MWHTEGVDKEELTMAWLLLLHVASAFWFVAGMIGRDLTLARARSSPDVGLIGALVALAGQFERLMVIPGSFAVIAAGVLVAWLQHRPFTGAGNWWLLLSLLFYLSTFALVPLVFLPRGRRFDAALAEAEGVGEVTPALTAAFADPAVRAARIYEMVMIAVVLTLMVVKPI
jgi:hypothetical protein